MKFPIGVVAMTAVLLGLAACSKSEPPAPAAPTKSRAELQREEFFGAEVAADAAVAWKPTGLGIKVLAPGEGTNPTIGDRVRLHYTGKLKDGMVFDDTRANGKPAEFLLNQMISGLSAGIPVLQPGGRAIFYIPPSLGYGSLRAGKIPPVSGLIFDVELLGIVPAS